MSCTDRNCHGKEKWVSANQLLLSSLRYHPSVGLASFSDVEHVIRIVSMSIFSITVAQQSSPIGYF